MCSSWALLSVTLLIAQAVGAAQLHFVDSAAHSFFRQSDGSHALSAAGTTTLMASLLGTRTPLSMEPAVSRQVDAILAPSVFEIPRAVVAVAIAGVTGAELAAAGELFKTTVSVSINGEGDGAASSLLIALDDISDAVRDDVLLKPLDNTGLPQYCDEACLEQSVWFVAELAGFNYSQRQQPDVDCGPVSWCAHITRGGRSGPKLLDMMQLPDRLAALELAQLSSTVHDLLARNDNKEMASPKPLLLETSLVGPQLLRNAHGQKSLQYAAVLHMAVSLLAELRQKLGEVLDKRVVLQVSTLGAVQLSGAGDMKELLVWRDMHRTKMKRRSLLESRRVSSTRQMGVGSLRIVWETNSTAWLIAILLLLGILAATSCIWRMDFEQDTLLFARSKTD